MVKALIEAGADVNKARQRRRDAAVHGRSEGHEAVVKALIEAGADVNKADNDGGRRCTWPLRKATRRWSRR